MGAAPGVSRIEFSVLGPFEVRVDGERVDLGGRRRRIVLATLAIEAGRPVSVERLMTALYGDDPPSTSRGQVQICISALRRLLGAYGLSDLIATRSHGYVIEAGDDDIDLRRYENLVARGRRLRDDRRYDEAAGCYRAGLALWSGPALDGLDGDLVRSAATRLDEQRVSVTEDCVELELAQGCHHDLLAELAELVERHPLRERLHGQLMLALYRSGRQAEALEVYRRARRLLVDELGIEPNAWLQQLERAILVGDARLHPPAAPPGFTGAGRRPPSVAVPRLLPTDIADFTGRAAQVRAMEQRFSRTGESREGPAVPITVVSGKPGVGKTALTVHVAHRLAGRFPDGQLFADLHGQARTRADPAQILERFLRILGVPGSGVPDGLEARAEMYRDLLSDRKVMVVLDNAGDESQVRPLLPGAPPAAVLVTGRNRLAGLAGAEHVELDVLDPAQSVELLARIAGAERMRAEERGAAELAELCGHLPLALRIAGARLGARPHWQVAQLVERLEDETRRLDELDHGGLGIRPSISLTYDGLGDDARRLFRRLALLDFPHFSGWVAAALLDQPYATGQDLLDDLAEAHLVDTVAVGQGAPSHYRLHDLIRVFARERVTAEEDAADRAAALERVLGALLFLADNARVRAYGGDYEGVRSDALRWSLPSHVTGRLLSSPWEWVERERPTIVAAVRQAAREGFAAVCWDLSDTAAMLYEARAYFSEWRETHQVALEAVRAAGDHRGLAMILYSTGGLHMAEHRHEEARRALESAADLFHGVGDEYAEARAIRNLAYIDRLRGDLDASAARYERVLGVFRSHGDLVAVAYVLYGLAHISLERGDAGAALTMLAEARELGGRMGNNRVQAQVLHRLGETYLQLDQPLVAADTFAETLSRVQDIGDSIGEAYALWGLGVAWTRTGRLEEAGTTLESALRSAQSAGERLIEGRVSLAFGEYFLAKGGTPQAVLHLHRALDLFRAVDSPLFESRALAMLATATATAEATR